jgi:hypothetical protein
MPFTECTVRGFIHVLCHPLHSESNGTDCAWFGIFKQSVSDAITRLDCVVEPSQNDCNIYQITYCRLPSVCSVVIPLWADNLTSVAKLLVPLGRGSSSPPCLLPITVSGIEPHQSSLEEELPHRSVALKGVLLYVEKPPHYKRRQVVTS